MRRIIAGMPVGTSASFTFVGREPELAELLRANELAEVGETTVVLVAGEAGVGKSRLLREFASRVAERGGLVLVGGCPFSPEVEIPFAPIIEILRSLRRRLPPAELTDAMGSHRRELARLLPGLDEGGPQAPAGSEPGVPSGATRLFEAIVGLLERLGQRDAPVVIVVEDLQWADRSTQALLAFMARILHEARVLVVASYRSDTIDRASPLARMLVELERASAVSRVGLERFDRDGVSALMTAMLGSTPDAQFLDEVVARSDGNAFYAEELTRAGLRARDAGLPDSLREVLLTHVAELPDEIQASLRLAAVAGRRFDHRLIAAAGNLDDGALSAALREAVARGFLVPVRDALGVALLFRHALIREVLEDELLPDEEARLHGAIARAMAEREATGGDLTFGPAELAHHWLLAHNDRAALPALVRAARGAEDRYAFPEAASQYRLALEIWDRLEREAAPPGETDGVLLPDWDRPTLIRRAAETANLAGRPTEAVELVEVFLSLTDAAVDPMGFALALESKARFLADAGDLQVALTAAREAVDVAGSLEPSTPQARVLVAYARMLLRAESISEALEASERAIEVSRRVGALDLEARARSILGVVLGRMGKSDQAINELSKSREILSSSFTSGNRPSPSRIMDVVGSYADRAEVLDRVGQSTEASLAIIEGADVARRLGVEATVGSTLEVEVAGRHFRHGEWEDAERLTRNLLAGGVRGKARVQANVLRARLATARGRYADAEAHLALAGADRRWLTDPATLRGYRAVAADLAIWRGHLSDARLTVASGLAAGIGSADRALAELVLLGIRAEADAAESARVRRAPNDVAEAVTIVNELLTVSRGILGMAVNRATSTASAADVPFSRPIAALGRLAEAEAARADGRLDAGAWAALSSEWSALREPYQAAYAGWRTAEALIIERGSRSKVTETARAAWRLAVDLGASPLQREIEALATRARVELGTLSAEDGVPPGPSGPAAALGLSAREAEVLILVSAGRTNRQIAEALFITEKTAAHHVSNILGKLGASSRVVAAAMAHRAGLIPSGVPALTDG